MAIKDILRFILHRVGMLLSRDFTFISYSLAVWYYSIESRGGCYLLPEALMQRAPLQLTVMALTKMHRRLSSRWLCPFRCVYY